MAEDVLAGILPALVEAVHVELPDEGVDIPVPEELGKDLVLKIIDLLDGEFPAVGHPVYDGLVILVLEDLETLLDKVGDRGIDLFCRHSLMCFLISIV